MLFSFYSETTWAYFLSQVFHLRFMLLDSDDLGGGSSLKLKCLLDFFKGGYKELLTG